MNELVKQMVQPRGATWQQGFISSVNSILSTIENFPRGKLSYVSCSIRSCDELIIIMCDCILYKTWCLYANR